MNITNFTKTQYAIISGIGTALADLDADSDLISIIMSWGDTQTDEDTLTRLIEYNENKRL